MYMRERERERQEDRENLAEICDALKNSTRRNFTASGERVFSSHCIRSFGRFFAFSHRSILNSTGLTSYTNRLK